MTYVANEHLILTERRALTLKLFSDALGSPSLRGFSRWCPTIRKLPSLAIYQNISGDRCSCPGGLRHQDRRSHVSCACGSRSFWLSEQLIHTWHHPSHGFASCFSCLSLYNPGCDVAVSIALLMIVEASSASRNTRFEDTSFSQEVDSDRAAFRGCRQWWSRMSFENRLQISFSHRCGGLGRLPGHREFPVELPSGPEVLKQLPCFFDRGEPAVCCKGWGRIPNGPKFISPVPRIQSIAFGSLSSTVVGRQIVHSSSWRRWFQF